MKVSVNVQRRRVKLREKLYAENPCCWWCGQTTHPPLKGRHPPKETRDLEASLEHLVAQINGGTDDPHNLVLACFKCNRRRGNETFFSFRTAWRHDALENKSHFPWEDPKNLYPKFNPVINESNEECSTKQKNKVSPAKSPQVFRSLKIGFRLFRQFCQTWSPV